jgi:hypothetical protein
MFTVDRILKYHGHLYYLKCLLANNHKRRKVCVGSKEGKPFYISGFHFVVL